VILNEQAAHGKPLEQRTYLPRDHYLSLRRHPTTCDGKCLSSYTYLTYIRTIDRLASAFIRLPRLSKSKALFRQMIRLDRATRLGPRNFPCSTHSPLGETHNLEVKRSGFESDRSTGPCFHREPHVIDPTDATERGNVFRHPHYIAVCPLFDSVHTHRST
jgi:hypothetical protein